ncbi:MAG: glycosyltransferase family 2 protein [Muribaculaceae bacterium]|nr:glycosyltransferase family 2 protein [Muribaculaceae bacterium]
MIQVSIIVPIYNVSHYIDRCLGSLREQTEQRIEVICVEDCSTDTSLQRVKMHVNADPRFKLICNETNRGPMVSRMLGVRQASGKYIMFCDADDYFADDAVEKMLHAIEHSGDDVVVAGYAHEGCSPHLRFNIPPALHNKRAKKWLPKILGKRDWHTVWSKIYRRELFDHNFHIFEHLSIGEDMVFFYEIMSHAKTVGSISDVVYYYFYNPKSLTRKRLSEDQMRQMVQTFKYIRRFLPHSFKVRCIYYWAFTKLAIGRIVKGYSLRVLFEELKRPASEALQAQSLIN